MTAEGDKDSRGDDQGGCYDKPRIGMQSVRDDGQQARCNFGGNDRGKIICNQDHPSNNYGKYPEKKKKQHDQEQKGDPPATANGGEKIRLSDSYKTQPERTFNGVHRENSLGMAQRHLIAAKHYF
jgi:hypothetical protein